MTEEQKTALFVKIFKRTVIGLVLIILAFCSFGTINAGERGVKTRLGNVVGTVDPGFYMKLPFIEKAKVVETVDYPETPDGDIPF